MGKVTKKKNINSAVNLDKNSMSNDKKRYMDQQPDRRQTIVLPRRQAGANT